MFNQKQTEKRIPSLMDAPIGKLPPLYQNCKSNFQHNHQFESNNYTPQSNKGYFKSSKIQNHSLKWKKSYYRGNCRSTNHPYRKNNAVNRKLNKSAEDAEEEERKKKLNDTAKKLLNKIKSWNAEKNVEEPIKPKEGSQQCDVSQVSSECSVAVHNEEKSESKKRIAHSKKAKFVKNRTPKRLKQPVKVMPKYEVNKETVKDFQNRIQHKLIEEIMQMPKENLQSVLNDPKINPIMGLKMSRLVQENRPLITQKLRALAESKMKSLGFTSNPQLLLVDIDKLIDPVIETDLSALPYELIKQMENLFQVQFDYSQSSESKGAFDSTGELQQNDLIDNLQNHTFIEDLSLYECSTDEDEEISLNNCSISCEEFAIPPMQDEPKTIEEDVDQKNINMVSCDDELCSSKATVISFDREDETRSVSKTLSEKSTPMVSLSSEDFTTASCQTDGCSHLDSSTQTPQEFALLYGVPLPTESKDNCASSLLEEVSAIQNLTNKLNERRLKIFLELLRMNPKGDFVSDDRAKENLTETLSNGSVFLFEALQEFFKVHSKSRKNLQFKSNDRKLKASRKCINKGKLKNKEESHPLGCKEYLLRLAWNFQTPEETSNSELDYHWPNLSVSLRISLAAISEILTYNVIQIICTYWTWFSTENGEIGQRIRSQ